MNERPDPPHPPIRQPSGSDRQVPRSILRPLQVFLSTAAASGTVLLIAAVVALVWANSPWGDTYEGFWSTPAELRVGTWAIGDDLRHWVNDGLMTLFFLVVGLEIKREIRTGELRDPRAATLPVAAAIGGMIVPALIYVALNAGGTGSAGWGIPMATDIAFALGVLVLAARHAPAGLKPFILTLAVVDDIGAILVIALFYAGGVSLGFLAAAAALCGLILLLQRAGVGGMAAFVGLGALVWLAIDESSVHPAIAGVVLGLLAPTEPSRHPRARSREVVSPLARLERTLLPWTSFVIIPLFALANVGVRLSREQVVAASTSRVTLGVLLGLVVGKVVGISGATALTVAMRVARLPTGVRPAHLFGASAVAGIGFTVSLFMAELAFDDELLITDAKVGILAASILAGSLGWIVLRFSPSVGDASLAGVGDGETDDPSGH